MVHSNIMTLEKNSILNTDSMAFTTEAFTQGGGGLQAERTAPRKAAIRAGLEWKESNHLALRRGPYVIGAGLDESVAGAAKELKGRFVDLFDPELKVRRTVALQPGTRAFLLDLDAVIEFYDDGGTLRQHVATNPDKHPDMVQLGLTESERKALRFFMACLTDPRVRFERAPFDHPSIVVVHGYEAAGGRIGGERLEFVPAIGAAGLERPLPLFPSAR